MEEDFSIPTYQEWRDLVEKNLKGIPFSKALVTKTYEEIYLQPIYRKADVKKLNSLNHKPGCGNYLRGTKIGGYLIKPWEICQPIPYNTIKEFNHALNEDLKLGLTSINLVVDKATCKGLDPDESPIIDVGKNGLSLSTLQDFYAALKGIPLENHSLHITPGPSGLVMLMALGSLFKQSGWPYKKMKGSINADPLAFLATFGNLPFPIETTFDHLASLAHWRIKNSPHLKTIGISSLPYHNSGAHAVQELAYAVATGVEYINGLLERNLAIDDIAGSIRFSLGIGPCYFMEIAKFRTIRLLWTKIIDTYGGNKDSQKANIQGVTSRYNQTLLDPHSNILRTVTGAFAAILGGVDSLQINSFDGITSKPNEFSRRIARNIHLILKEESHLDQFIDPAGGSYYIECLTQQLGERAWTLFQELEKQGGMLKVLQKGIPQKEIRFTAQKRKLDLAKRKLILVGTNLYPNDKESQFKTYQPSLKNLYTQRSQNIKSFKENRCSSIGKKITSKIASLKEGPPEDVISAGIDLLLEGATFGEISAIFETDKSISVKPVNIHRLSEDFEKIRSAVASYGKKRGTKPKVLLISTGSQIRDRQLITSSQDIFEIGGFQVAYSPTLPSEKHFADRVLASRASVVAICFLDYSGFKSISPIIPHLKNQNSNIIIVATTFSNKYSSELEQEGLDLILDLNDDIVVFLKNVLVRMGISA
jgi:methylmalonyl-CoA mutase